MKRRIVGALLLSQDNQILLGYKDPSRGGRYSDCWVLPGGGVEQGETDLEALHREILEETGIDISAYDAVLLDDSLSGVTETTHKLTGEPMVVEMRFFDYLVRIPQDANDIAAAPSDDLAEVAWLPFDTLSEYKLSPSVEELLSKHGFLLAD